MHELSVAMSLLRACRAEIDRRGGGRLRAARIAVGEFAGVDPSLLRYAWPPVLAQTDDEGAALELEWEPAEQSCPSCGPVIERQPGSWLRLCPTCGSPLSVSDASRLEIVRLDFPPVG